MKRVILTVLFALLLVLWISPLFWLVSTSLKSEQDVLSRAFAFFPSGPTLENYQTAFGSTHLVRWLRNSIVISVATMVFTVAIDAPIAYALARIRFRGRQLIFWTIMAGMIIPFAVLIVPLYLQFNTYGLLNSLAVVVLPRLALPIGVFILKQFYEGIPAALEEAAFIDGASRVRTFVMIIIPVGRAALATVIILSFITAWNDFLWPLIAVTDTVKYTITVGIANFQGTHGTEYALIMAGAVVASLPQFIFYAFFRKKIVAGVAMSGIKG